jgi:predicted dehydrogenase
VNAEESRLGVAVIGVGHLGSRHAGRLRASPLFDLTAVYDQDPERAQSEAARWETQAAPSLEAAIDRAQAVVVATSTSSHFQAADAALRAGRHVLVEKPITGRVADAEALVARATSAGVVLQVGQVERFNPAIRGLIGRVPRPLFVESHRLASLVPRNLDLDVVEDLMVHDLDLTLAFVNEEPERVDAVGVPVLTGRVDIANARLRFPGGTVANLTASRVSRERVRKFRMFLPGIYVSADCATGAGTVARLRAGRESRLREALATGHVPAMDDFLDVQVEQDPGPDALTLEHEHFYRAILGATHSGVSGTEALRTLRAMVAVKAAMA